MGHMGNRGRRIAPSDGSGGLVTDPSCACLLRLSAFVQSVPSHFLAASYNERHASGDLRDA